MIIRRAKVEDAEALFEVHQGAVNSFCASSYTPEHMAEWFLGRTAKMYEPAVRAGRLWLAEANNRVLGFVGAVPGEVTLLFVAPEASGQSVGGTLLEFGFRQAESSPQVPVVVIATTNSVSFYRRHGFQVVGEQFFVRGDPPREYPVVKMVHARVPAHEAPLTDA
jgi:ribosomal protein S18 acetylase RimI-like enzyme